MLGNEAVHDLPSGSQGAQGPRLVLAHETRVSGHVGGEDRRQTPFDPLFLLGLHPTSPAFGSIVLRTGRRFKGRLNG